MTGSIQDQFLNHSGLVNQAQDFNRYGGDR